MDGASTDRAIGAGQNWADPAFRRGLNQGAAAGAVFNAVGAAAIFGGAALFTGASIEMGLTGLLTNLGSSGSSLLRLLGLAGTASSQLVKGCGEAPMSPAGSFGSSSRNYEVAERVASQLADPRLGPLVGRISADQLQDLASNPNAMHYLDTASGHTNILQLVEGRLLRITIADGSRIISVGPIQRQGAFNGVANGRFEPTP